MASPRADFVLYNIGVLYSCAGPAPRRGSALRQLAPVERAAVAAAAGRIVYVGPEKDLHDEVDLAPDALARDAHGRLVLPGFVDAHTHLVYAGDRLSEFRERMAGVTYQEIAARGGGILSTVDKTRKATVDELVEQTRPRLDRMLASGTTTAEAKSGYGLTIESELKMLEAIGELDRTHPVDLVPTFLGAHEVPVEYRENRAGYVDLLLDEMLPRAAEPGLAEWCDVFCEVGVFSVEETRRILTKARELGLKLRLHADEFASSGGAELAVELGARSADHLMRVSPEGIRALAGSSTAATLLPIASFYLRQAFAPARALVDDGAVVALGTDVNPGGGLSPSMPFAMALASLGAGLTLEESLLAATVNAAYAVDRAQEVGSVEVGKKMDAILLSDRDPACLLALETGAVDTVIKEGRVVVEGGGVVREAARRPGR
jgi:imidazolonepropionase